MFGAELDILHAEISKCRLCAHRDDFAPTLTYIGQDARVLILGEAPAKNGWRISGRAWYKPDGEITPSGKILKRLLAEIGLVLEDLSFTEAIKCTPNSPKYLKQCGVLCRKFLMQQIKILNPKIIVPLGVRASELLLPPFVKFQDVAGKVFKTDFGTVIPIYHPSPISPMGYKGNVGIMQTIKEHL